MTQSVDIQTKTRHFSSLGNSDAEYTSFLPVVSSMDLYFKVKTKFFKKSLRREQATWLCYPLVEHNIKSGKKRFPPIQKFDASGI